MALQTSAPREHPPLPAHPLSPRHLLLQVGLFLNSARVAKAVQRVFLKPAEFSSEAKKSSRNILVFRNDGIGDLILTSAFLRELRRYFPISKISLLVLPEFRNLVEQCPYVDEVVSSPHLGGLNTLVRFIRATRFASRTFAGRPFSLAILPSWEFDYTFSSLLVFFSNASVRLAYSEDVNALKSIINRGFDRFFTRTVHDRTIRHEVEYTLGLLPELGARALSSTLETWIDDDDRAFISRTLLREGIQPADSLIALMPGSGKKNKIWPVERFTEICRWMAEVPGVRIVAVGGNQDRELGEAIARAGLPGLVNLAGTLTLRQVAALVRLCSLYVGNDTGIMHMAAASDLDVVEISCHPRTGQPGHRQSPTRFGPWTTRSAVVQPAHPTAPCNASCEFSVPHCILSIDVDQVKSVIAPFLKTMRSVETRMHENGAVL